MYQSLIQYVIIYLLGIAFTIVSVVYLFRLPFLIAGPQSAIVDEYYITNFITNVPLDIVFITIYVLVAIGITRLLGYTFVKDLSISFLVLVLTTISITGFFWLLCSYMMPSEWFFPRWFHIMKASSIVYDVSLLSVLLFTMAFMTYSLHI